MEMNRNEQKWTEMNKNDTILVHDSFSKDKQTALRSRTEKAVAEVEVLS